MASDDDNSNASGPNGSDDDNLPIETGTEGTEGAKPDDPKTTTAGDERTSTTPATSADPPAADPGHRIGVSASHAVNPGGVRPRTDAGNQKPGGRVGRIPASILKCWRKIGEKILRTFQEIPNPRQVFSCFFGGTWNFRFSDEVSVENAYTFLRDADDIEILHKQFQRPHMQLNKHKGSWCHFLQCENQIHGQS